MRIRHDPRQQPQRLVARRHGDERPRHLLRVPIRLARNALAGHVDLEARPAERAPEERLDDTDRLNAAVWDGLVAALEQTAVEAHAVARLADGEIEVLVEGSGDAESADDQDGDHTAERAGSDDRRSRDRGDGGDGDEERRQDVRTHQERGEQQPVLHVQERQRGRLGCPSLQTVGEREQPGSDHGRLGGGEVRKPAVLGASTGGDDTHFGEAEKAPRKWRDDVNRLDPRQRDAERLPPDEPGLDLEVAVGDPPAGDQPRDHPADTAEDEQTEVDDHRDRQPPVVPRAGLLGEGRHRDAEDPDQHPAETDDRRQRVQPAPGLAHLERYCRDHRRRHHAHRPVALASPTRASRSRSASASGRGSPGMRASVAAAAVWSWTVARPKARSMGPAVTSMNCMRP